MKSIQSPEQTTDETDLVVSGLSYEWSINHLTFFETQRLLEGGRTTARLGVSLVQSRLNPPGEWNLHGDVRFTFSLAEVQELQG